MALKKQIVDDAGVAAEYWKIGRVHIDTKSKDSLELGMDLYLDQIAREDGKSPYSRVTIVVAVTSDEIDNNPVLALAYSKLKAEDSFCDAADV